MQRNPIRVAGIFALACALYAFGQASVPEYNIYYGDNHAHTSYSDGMGRRNPDGTAPPGRRPTPADAFAQARASGRADYFVASEHSGYARGAYFNLNPALWESARKMADEGSKDGAFIAIAGLEYSPQGKFLEGHMNVFNTGSELYPDPHPREEFYDLIANKNGVVAQWNHPALQYDLNNFKQFSGWTPARNRAITMLEIYSDNQGRSESSYQLALDRNWKICPTATSDTHSDDWIVGYETRTAVLATHLTRDNIYDAWRNRRCYATENRNLRIRYQINGYPMGSAVPPSSRYTVTLVVEDPDTKQADDQIRTSELVSNKGAVIASKPGNGHRLEWKHEIAATGQHLYYYVRVTNVKGQMAWSAPIWVPATRMTVTSIRGVSSQLNLAWPDTRKDEEGYQIWRSVATDNSWQLWKVVAADTNNYVDESVAAGTTYSYKVRPFRGTTMYEYSDAASATTTGPDKVPPTVPTGFAVVSKSPARIDFVFPRSTDDQLLMGYGMVRDGVDLALGGFAGFTERLVSGKTMVKASDVDHPARGHRVEPETTYRYQIYSVDWAGNRSPLSEALSVKTDAGQDRD